MSTVCSGIKELIARALNMRATTLENAVRNLLADPQGSITSKIIQNHLIAGTEDPGAKPPYISSRNFALSLFDVIAPVKPGEPRTVQDLKNGIGNLPDPRVSKALLGLLDSAQQDVDLARLRVENWYDDAMERVSGAYKRRAQVWIAVPVSYTHLPNVSPSIVTLRHKLDSGGAAAVKNFWDAVHKSCLLYTSRCV